MSDKIKEFVAKYSNTATDQEDEEMLAELNQMLIKEYRRGGYFELAKLKSHKIVSPDGVFNKAEQHKRLSKLAKEAGSTESELNQMLIEAEARHLSDISRAVGILDGLGFPDEYLNNQRAKLMKALKAEKDNHADQ